MLRNIPLYRLTSTRFLPAFTLNTLSSGLHGHGKTAAWSWKEFCAVMERFLHGHEKPLHASLSFQFLPTRHSYHEKGMFNVLGNQMYSFYCAALQNAGKSRCQSATKPNTKRLQSVFAIISLSPSMIFRGGNLVLRWSANSSPTVDPPPLWAFRKHA